LTPCSSSQTIEELVAERVAFLIEGTKAAVGVPCAGSTTDIWSLASCRESFSCFRLSLVVNGDLIAELTGDDSYKGTLVDLAPILEFERVEETRHTGAALARGKKKIYATWKLESAVGLATEDGASNNKAANRLLNQDMEVCTPHDVARAVLIAAGLSGVPCKNPELRDLIARSSKQAGSFSRSVIANKALQEEQLKANDDLKAHECLTAKTKNQTRWLGLWEMANRNRRIGVEMRLAMTGDADGLCVENPAPVPARAAAADGSEDEQSGDEDDDQDEANRATSKQFPLAHRCLALSDYRKTDVLESVLDRPREITLVCQAKTDAYGESFDLGMNYLIIETARDEAKHDRVELVSGRGDTEAWKETNAAGLDPMFKTFRKEFAAQLTARFKLDTTPSKHVLLALKLNPSVNTASDSPQMENKSAKYELMQAEYVRALRRQALFQMGRIQPPPCGVADSPATAPNATAPNETAPNTTAPNATALNATAQDVAAPSGKRRKSLIGATVKHTAGGGGEALQEDSSRIDMMVKAETDRFEMISMKILAQARSIPCCTLPLLCALSHARIPACLLVGRAPITSTIRRRLVGSTSSSASSGWIIKRHSRCTSARIRLRWHH
jgi:hypothetical protein